MRADRYELEALLAGNHWWLVARRNIISKIMDRYLDSDRRYRLLEVGCGTGSNLPMLSQYGVVQGIEMSPVAIEFCRKRSTEFNVVEGVIPMELDQEFDVICLFDVLEHIEDDRKAIQWIYEHLSPGGFVFFSVPAYQFLWSMHDEVSHHFRRYTRRMLVERLNECFSVHYATYFNTHLFPAIAGYRLIQRILRLPGGEYDVNIASKGLMNELLKTIFSTERFWVPTISLPFGVSICAVGEKAMK